MAKYALILAALLGCAGADGTDLYTRTGEFEGPEFYEDASAEAELGSTEQALINSCVCYKHHYREAFCVENGVRTLAAIFYESQSEAIFPHFKHYNADPEVLDESDCEGYHTEGFQPQYPITGTNLECSFTFQSLGQCWDPISGHPHP